MTQAKHQSNHGRNATIAPSAVRHRALSLIELVALLAIGTVVLGAAVQGLHAARAATRDEVCLVNLKDLGIAVRAYAAEYENRLPGPLHPAVQRYQTLEGYERWGLSPSQAAGLLRSRLTWLLRDFADTERVAFCPTMGGIVPDRHFVDYGVTNGKIVMPTHFALNNYGLYSADGGQSGLTGNPRVTDPPYYFGLFPYPGAPQAVIDEANRNPPQPMGRIRRASEEWMIADAWYRGKSNPMFLPQQEGPYQSAWSGQALPGFAPHFKRGSTAVPLSASEWTSFAAKVSSTRSDGMTNTAFFDGHAASVPSRSMFYVNRYGSATPDLLYGFPGTVNGTLPPASVGGSLVWR